MFFLNELYLNIFKFDITLLMIVKKFHISIMFIIFYIELYMSFDFSTKDIFIIFQKLNRFNSAKIKIINNRI